MKRTNKRWHKLINYIRNRWGVEVLSRLLTGTSLRYARLHDADLQGANLQGADFLEACFESANLESANLEGADLEGADFEDANLQDANLQDAGLRGASLEDANLEGANLEGANLVDAYLEDANLNNVHMNWQSHDLIAERLRQAAGNDVTKLAASTYILDYRDKCWEQLIAHAPNITLSNGESLLDWAMKEMWTWVKSDDDVPYEFTEYMKETSDDTN